MDRERWLRVRGVYEAASELSVDSRPGFLDRACDGDDELRREVLALVRAGEGLAEFLEEPAQDLETPPPDRIGPYAVRRELGRGGMGTVYLAERADEAYQKKVAIKVIRPGMDSEAVLQRFAAERQILASLDHPNIARLFDAGTTVEGLPYFVMEYIEGEPLDEYCERRRSTVRRRLEIFRRVCDAVDEAHRKLVLHRDLKPGNILVDERGVPKLLDFGIAKLLVSDGGGEMTELGLRLMTPQYASPEQLHGEPLTMASDVFSLGVVLYQLVTGNLPATPMPENPRIDADLDNIVLVALRPEPALRYASAARLGEDIDRYLSGRPVLARPLTLTYRVRKFAGRHRGALAAAAAVAASLVAGVVALTLQWQTTQHERARAERRFADVRDLASAFVFEFDQAIRDLPGSTPARALVVRRGLEYLDRLASEAGDDPSLQRELAAAYDQLGDLQGGFRAANLGDSAGALASYRKALELRQRLATQAGADGDLARSHARVGALLFSRGEADAAHAHLREATEIYAAMDSPPVAALIDTQSDLGYLLENRGDVEAALSTFALAEKLQPQPGPQLIKLWSRKARALSNLVDRRGEALDLERRALALAESLAAASPESAPLRWTAMMQHAVLGIIEYEADSASAAEAAYQRAISAGEDLLAADPENAQWRYDLALCYALAGHVRSGAKAIAALQRSLELAEPLLRRDPEDADVAGVVALAQAGLARALAPSACTEARAWFERAAPVLARLEGKQVQAGWERRLALAAAARVEACGDASG